MIGVLVMVVFVPVLLFAAAGTLAWPMAWVYVALSTVGTVTAHLLVARRNPDTLEERARGFRAGGIQWWDRWVLPVLIWSSVLILPVAGLDHRFGWSHVGAGLMWVRATGLVLAAAGYVFTGWAMVENRFFSGTARIQADRGHTVVSGGPYRLVRHPGYAGSLLATVSVPVILGTWWAYVPAGIAMAAIVARTVLEDRMLRGALDGYEAFAARTRWRLAPGVW